jgi:hypothetical protein
VLSDDVKIGPPKLTRFERVAVEAVHRANMFVLSPAATPSPSLLGRLQKKAEKY